MTGRPGAHRPELPSAALTGGEYVALVVILAAGIVAAALLVSWAAQQRGLLAPGTVPNWRPPAEPASSTSSPDDRPDPF